MREFFIRELVKNVYGNDLCRELFKAEGIPEPSRGAMDACRSAAISAALALPADSDDQHLMHELASAFVVAVQEQAAWYQRQWNAIAA
jgi:hypothetical protein